MIGTKVAHYEITSHLGSGGMGDVYQASDSKLGRDVAIKFLPESFARDSERVLRFEREARVLASLNHPNIAAIYGMEQAASRQFLVMELVGGETLAERITRGPLPIDEALGIAKQICEALEAAHGKGIIHRDLKPSNIKLTADGKVKVLDFGLAKANEPAPSGAGLSNSPTMLSMAGTNPGIVLGTASYMSPEQAKGRSVDKRTDIFAFGCVLYEMLSGKRVFDGEDVAEILSRVLQREPDWTLLPAGTPSGIKRLLFLCLEKNPKSRRRDAGDILIDIDLAITLSGEAVESVSRARTRAGFAWILTSGLLAFTSASLALVHFREKPPATPSEWRLDIATPVSASPLSFALSPDGRSIVFAASGSGSGVSQLWLRRLDQQTEARALPRTEGAIAPFWKPDGKSIAFVADSQLKRVDVDSGSLGVLASNVRPGGSWNASGTIIFAGAGATLQRIPDSGGQTEIVSDTGPAGWPQFLPDGRNIIFHSAAGTGAGSSALYLASLDGGVQKRLGPADSGASWLAPDRLVFVLQGRLVARHLDLNRKEFVGDPEIIADAVGTGANFQSGFSVSTGGSIAYRSGSPAGSRQLVWLDRAGNAVSKPLEVRDAAAFEISPNGMHLALDRTVQDKRDVYLMDDIGREGMKKLTLDSDAAGLPVWFSDGSQIAFESRQNGEWDIYAKSSSGGVKQPLLLEPGSQWPMSFSKDYMLYYDTRNSGELLALPLSALPFSGNDPKAIPVATKARRGTLSPDGRWVAYETTAQSERFEIFVQSFPKSAGQWQVSVNGGTHPRWRADGKELYFIYNNRLMAATVRTSGSSFGYDTPVELFQTRFAIEGTSAGASGGHPPYDVSSKDGRFLVNQLLETSTNAPISILLNWKSK
jgi:serine/threonine protein kinase/Tol biopolymer transport system component